MSERATGMIYPLIVGPQSLVSHLITNKRNKSGTIANNEADVLNVPLGRSKFCSASGCTFPFN